MLEFGKALDIGKTRLGKKNQDNLKIIRRWSKRPLLVIADGMGGYEGGAEASRLVIKTFQRTYKVRVGDSNITQDLLKAISVAHNRIIQRSKSSENLSKMGSTVVAVAVDKKKNLLHIANVGDSRAYLITREAIRQISYDHSEVAELLRNGMITPEEAQNYKRKNVLTMSLSGSRPEGSLTPFLQTESFPKDCVILLCSDGLWGPVEESLIHLIALEYAPQAAAERLVKMANMNGGPDNISVLIARRKSEWKEYKKKYSRDLEDTNG